MQDRGYTHIVRKEAGALYRHLRRRFYYIFRRNYVRTMIANRKGVCGRHGCCDLSILTRFRACIDPADRTKCLKWRCLPFHCQRYPFDEKDKIPETRSYCSFYWLEENSGTDETRSDRTSK